MANLPPKPVKPKLVVVAGTITSKLITTVAFVDRLRTLEYDVTLHIPPGEALSRHGIQPDLDDLRVRAPDWTPPSAEAIAAYQKRLQADEADLYIIDIEAHEYILAALAAELPVVLLNVFFNMWKLPGVPPVHQNVIPGQGLRGSRLGIEYGWAGYRAFRSAGIARSILRRDDQRHHLLAFARRLGIDIRATLTEAHGLIPFMYRTIPSLTLNMEELELPGAVHPLNHYVGAMPNSLRPDLALSETEEQTLAEVEAFCAGEGEGKKLIYCAFGAYYDGDDLDFWRRAIGAIGSRRDWLGVFGLGGRITPQDLGPLPDSVRAYPWAPQLRILERADCAVIHGGMTSVYECVSQQVPMVVLPLGDSFDQFGTACRVGYHRVGIVGDRLTATKDQIVDMIESAMADSAMAERLAALNRHMGRYETDRALAYAIDELIADFQFQ